MAERYVPDYDARLYDAMLSYMRDGMTTRSLLASSAEIIQEIEDMLFDLQFSSRLDQATRVFLDQWGTLVNEKRGVLTDPEYRRVIRARVQANRSNALIGDLIGIASTLFEPTDLELLPNYPAGYRIEFQTEKDYSDDFLRRAVEVLEAARPAGVGQTVVKSPATNVFRLSSTNQTLDGPQLSSRII